MRRLIACCVLISCVSLLALASRDIRAEDPQRFVLWVPLTNALYDFPPTPVPATIAIAPSCSQFDAPGDDNLNLNEEYVCLSNNGQVGASLAGWQIGDQAGKRYTFGAFFLGGGQSVRLHTGRGTDTATDLYWGLGRAVWNNDHDTVYLYDAFGTLVDQYSY